MSVCVILAAIEDLLIAFCSGRGYWVICVDVDSRRRRRKGKEIGLLLTVLPSPIARR